jgi:hypothetical protein
LLPENLQACYPVAPAQEGVAQKADHAHATRENQRSQRFDRLSHASAVDIWTDSQSHYLKLRERTLSFADFPAERG